MGGRSMGVPAYPHRNVHRPKIAAVQGNAPDPARLPRDGSQRMPSGGRRIGCISFPWHRTVRSPSSAETGPDTDVELAPPMLLG